MIIGIPRERGADENRVGLAPAAVQSLVTQGHDVVVESSAGAASGFLDDDYLNVGANLVHSCAEVYGRSGMIVKVMPPQPSEYECISEDQIILAYLHLAVADPKLINILLDRNCTAIDYATIEDDRGHLPVLRVMSQIAGLMIPQLAARYLQSDHGGSGILLGGAPAVPPAEVVVIGGGVVGRNAARSMLGVGARVTLLDVDYERLRHLHWNFDGRATTYVANEYTLPKALAFADVVVGAVLIPGARTPHLVDKEMIGLLRDGSVIFDVSIDQGGCFETSRPTRLSDPTYTVDGKTHYCVPNLSSLVARSATYALGNITLPFVSSLAAEKVALALAGDKALQHGVNIHRGEITHRRVADAHGLEHGTID